MSEFHLIAGRKKKPVNLPEPQLPVADSHCHLTMLSKPAYILARAAVAGIDFLVVVVNPAISEGESPEVFFNWLEKVQSDAYERLQTLKHVGLEPPQRPGMSSSERLPQHIRLAVGIHPHNASSYSPELERVLYEYLKDERVSTIGEIGLDYFYNYSPPEVQREVFKRQLVIAQEEGFPVALHLRDAHQDALKILDEVGIPEKGCVLHCFGENQEVAQPFLDRGCYISYAGPFTFKKSDELRETALLSPANRLMVETDSPFMSPEPIRGRECEPTYTVFTAHEVARVQHEATGVSKAKALEQLYSNALAFYDQER